MSTTNKLLSKRQNRSGTTFALCTNGATFGVYKLRHDYNSGRYTPFWGVVAEGLDRETAERLLQQRAPNQLGEQQ